MISIVMPVRNAAPYLKECIQSIVDQSCSEWELLAVNDHSTDDSASILQQFAVLDDRIQWMDAEGKGIIPALRQAYNKSSQPYITRMDADDVMTHSKLEDMLTVVQQHGPGTLAVGLVSYFSDSGMGEGYLKYADWLNDMTRTESNFNQIYKECVIPSPCWMLSRTDFDSLGAFNTDTYPEDYDLCFRFRNAGLKIAAVPKILHHWRDHSERASRNDPNYADNRFLALKVHHFLKTDYTHDTPLIVWGAGKKGKQIIQLLQADKIPVKWICDNSKKIGKEIYDIKMDSIQLLEHISDAQLIIAVANPNEQQTIRSYLSSKEKLQPFFFC